MGLFSDGDWIETKDQDFRGTVRLVQLADVGDGVFRDRSKRFMNYSRALELNCTFLEYGDILIARMPDPLGRAIIFPFNEKNKYVTVVDVAIIRTGNQLQSKFIMHLINSPEVRAQINTLQTGTTRKRISKSNLSQIMLPIAPLREQVRIVEKIEELFSELEQVKQSLTKTKDKLKIFHDVLLLNAFSGKLTEKWRQLNLEDANGDILNEILEDRAVKYKADLKQWRIEIEKWIIDGKKGKQPQKPRQHNYKPFSKTEIQTMPTLPENWVWAKVSAFEELVSSGSTPKGGKNVYTQTGVPFLRSQNIHPNSLKLNDVAYINPQVHEQMARTQLKGGDVLLNITGASIGRCAFLPENYGEGNVNQHVCIIRSFTKKINYQFVTWYMNSPFAQQIIDKVNSGATREALTTEQVKNFPIPIPLEGEQNEILQKLNQKTSVADNLSNFINDSLIKVNLLHRTILSAAYHGRLVKQNNHDDHISHFLTNNITSRELAAIQKKERTSINTKPFIVKKTQTDIIQQLTEAGKPVSAKELWENGKFNDDIEGFYNELKKLQNQVVEVEKGFLSLAK